MPYTEDKLEIVVPPGWAEESDTIDAMFQYPASIIKTAVPDLVGAMITDDILWESSHDWNFKFTDQDDPIGPYIDPLAEEAPLFGIFQLVGSKYADVIINRNYDIDLDWLASRVCDIHTTQLFKFTLSVIENYLLSRTDLEVISQKRNSHDIAYRIAGKLFYHNSYINAIRSGFGLPPKELTVEDVEHLREIYGALDCLNLPRTF